MGSPRIRSMSVILQELGASLAQHDREVAALRKTVDRLQRERDELVAQILFTSEQANRETRAAGSLRAELLSRTSVPSQKLDFCCAGDGGETTAVLPTPRLVPTRRHVREDETERCIRRSREPS